MGSLNFAGLVCPQIVSASLQSHIFVHVYCSKSGDGQSLIQQLQRSWGISAAETVVVMVGPRVVPDSWRHSLEDCCLTMWRVGQPVSKVGSVKVLCQHGWVEPSLLQRQFSHCLVCARHRNSIPDEWHLLTGNEECSSCCGENNQFCGVLSVRLCPQKHSMLQQWWCHDQTPHQETPNPTFVNTPCKVVEWRLCWFLLLCELFEPKSSPASDRHSSMPSVLWVS